MHSSNEVTEKPLSLIWLLRVSIVVATEMRGRLLCSLQLPRLESRNTNFHEVDECDAFVTIANLNKLYLWALIPHGGDIV